MVWDEKSQYKGKVTAYDSPIYIADAALYLKATQPDLGINNVYELDQKQFDAAIDLLKEQRTIIGEYWSDYTKEIDAFAKGNSVVGTTWQVIANLLTAEKVKVKATTLPKEGSTGWSDTWMISSKAENPNCMYMLMNHIISPEANAKVAEYFGEAPSNTKSCALTADKEHCNTFHADRRGLLRQGRLLDDPGEGLRRRPRRGLQGLLGVGQGLDRASRAEHPEHRSLSRRRPGRRVAPVHSGG